MLPLLEIPETPIKNQHLFKDDFFTSYPLSPSPQDLLLPNGQLRNYQFPTYFDKVQFSAGVFFCDYEQAAKHMPNSDLKPVSALYKRAIVIIASYQYREIHQMQGYNEVLVMIPVLNKSTKKSIKTGPNIPLLPPLIPGYPGAGYYIIALPMTSLENMLRGQQLWGLPKTMHDVAINNNEGKCETDIKDGTELDFTLRIPMQGKTKKSDQKSHVFSMKDNKLIRFHTHFKGVSQTTSNMKVLLMPNKVKDQTSDSHSLTLGQSPLASMLKQLKINPIAFQTRYCNDLKSCLFLPD